MPAPTFTVEQLQSALQNLLPQGKVWPRDPDAMQSLFWKCIAQAYKRQCDDAAFLLVDAFPATTQFLLPEWEATLGLPDDCITAPQTIAQRVASVVVKLTKTGGQSTAYFIGLANAMGYENCTITQHAPFRAGRSRCGDPVGDEGWFFVWTLNVPELAVTYFRAGQATAGDPLYALGGEDLQCTIQRYAPAHTNVLFSGVI